MSLSYSHGHDSLINLNDKNNSLYYLLLNLPENTSRCDILLTSTYHIILGWIDILNTLRSYITDNIPKTIINNIIAEHFSWGKDIPCGHVGIDMLLKTIDFKPLIPMSFIDYAINMGFTTNERDVLDNKNRLAIYKELLLLGGKWINYNIYIIVCPIVTRYLWCSQQFQLEFIKMEPKVAHAFNQIMDLYIIPIQSQLKSPKIIIKLLRLGRISQSMKRDLHRTIILWFTFVNLPSHLPHFSIYISNLYYWAINPESAYITLYKWAVEYLIEYIYQQFRYLAWFAEIINSNHKDCFKNILGRSMPHEFIEFPQLKMFDSETFYNHAKTIITYKLTEAHNYVFNELPHHVKKTYYQFPSVEGSFQRLIHMHYWLSNLTPIVT